MDFLLPGSKSPFLGVDNLRQFRLGGTSGVPTLGTHTINIPCLGSSGGGEGTTNKPTSVTTSSNVTGATTSTSAPVQQLQNLTADDCLFFSSPGVKGEKVIFANQSLGCAGGVSVNGARVGNQSLLRCANADYLWYTYLANTGIFLFQLFDYI